MRAPTITSSPAEAYFGSYYLSTGATNVWGGPHLCGSPVWLARWLAGLVLDVPVDWPAYDWLVTARYSAAALAPSRAA